MKIDIGSTRTTSEGVGFCGLLCITFIVLKLCKVIDWSWWLVLAPIWIPIAFFILVVGIVAGFCGIRKLFRNK